MSFDEIVRAVSLKKARMILFSESEGDMADRTATDDLVFAPVQVAAPALSTSQGEHNANETSFDQFLKPEFTESLLNHMHRAKVKAIHEGNGRTANQ